MRVVLDEAILLQMFHHATGVLTVLGRNNVMLCTYTAQRGNTPMRNAELFTVGLWCRWHCSLKHRASQCDFDTAQRVAQRASDRLNVIVGFTVLLLASVLAPIAVNTSFEIFVGVTISIGGALAQGSLLAFAACAGPGSSSAIQTGMGPLCGVAEPCMSLNQA